jgi:hypothetical protein
VAATLRSGAGSIDEVRRVTEQLSLEFGERVDRATLETVVRADFARRSDVRIHDFVSIFVERDLRLRLRNVG